MQTKDCQSVRHKVPSPIMALVRTTGRSSAELDPAVLLPNQQAKLAKNTKDKERAMSDAMSEMGQKQK
jgi:hypothetical protein